MAKRKYTTEYFDLSRMINTYDTSYYIIYGQREDGKSYSVKNYIIQQIKMGFNFAYIRRAHSHIVRKNMIKVFDDVQHIAEKELGSKIYYDSQMGFYLKINGEPKIVGYCSSLTDVMQVKSIPVVNISTILFDEFIDYMYMDNEISMFLHCMSTICRPPNTNVKIFMLGNTISKNCPYFKLFGIDPQKIKQGEIYYIKHNLGVTACVQHTPTKVDDIITKKKTHSYIGFDDNESVNMIMFGEWEYQHCKTQQIDGISWNCMKHFIPIYFTALNMVYEFAIHTDSKMPILFVRKVNTQLGKVKKRVLYNLAYDDTVHLINDNGFVPTISKVNKLVDQNTLKKWELLQLCIDCDRVIYDTIATGSEFMSLFRKIKIA
jgi:hypothetical protein